MHKGLFFELKDFDAIYFSDNWHVVYDKVGDGSRLDFPIRLESRIKWSSIVYNSDGSVKPRVFTEMISVTIYCQEYRCSICLMWVNFDPPWFEGSVAQTRTVHGVRP